ncbi:MAG: flagellar biosynthesis protein FliQ [Alphaproteobacteria bacterium]|nr:flagellar biosynthesis protein FliQ [Alphaproteobacteria bacterium]
MEANDVIDVARDAIIVMLQVSTPVMLVGLTVGLVVALFQALTQIQEMTLTFVPKIIAIFASLLLFMPFMGRVMDDLMVRIAERIASL